jgi:hypothetical protein
VYCQVEVSATSWSLVQSSPTDCGASLGVITKRREREDHSPRRAAVPERKIKHISSNFHYCAILSVLILPYDFDFNLLAPEFSI